MWKNHLQKDTPNKSTGDWRKKLKRPGQEKEVLNRAINIADPVLACY
jgi:hypothetical protein